MKPVFSILVVSALAVLPAFEAAEFKFGGQTFTLPEGFTMERVAGPGVVDRPIEADFDDQGRLYVSDSSGSNEPVAKQLEDKPHQILRLEDTNGDGVFDKSVVFADKMMFPEGVMWLDGSLYVSAPPVIWKLTDTNGDGTADKREEWLDAKTLTGCANDLHGPYLGIDGWVYWSKGAFAKQTYDRPPDRDEGRPFETRAAHIFRRRPEGGLIEPVMTGGMDNPVGVVFTPEGERIFTTTFFQHPGGGQRDGLIHAIYGGVYGKDHDVIDDHKRTGGLMPVLTHLGPAAPCGLVRYESEAFGPGYRDNLFACLFNLHKVTRHVLKPSGATYETEDSDFLSCDSTDFHPTDVLEDADGSLLVIDTGGWYKLCCPTSQLWKPDVLGAIYRIRRTGAPLVKDAWGNKLNWKTASTEELAGRLRDPRPYVTRRAIQQLRLRDDAPSRLRTVISGEGASAVKRDAVWALTGAKASESRAVVRTALKDSSPSVRQAALHSISVVRDQGAVQDVQSMLAAVEAPVRRSAAEALGRIGSEASVQSLLTAAGQGGGSAREGNDAAAARVQEHSLIYALIEINAPTETRVGLKSDDVRVRRAALMALDQMERGELKPEDVLPILEENSAGSKELVPTANWIISHRKEWGEALAEYFEKKIRTAGQLNEGERSELEQQVAMVSSTPTLESLARNILGGNSNSPEARLLMLDTLKQSRAKDLSDPSFLLHLLRSSDSEWVQKAASVAGAVTFKGGVRGEVQRELMVAARNKNLSAAARLEALNVVAGGSQLDSNLFDLVRAHLASEIASALRTHAVSILGKAKLDEDQLKQMASELVSAGPLEISRLVDIFEKSSNASVGEALLGGLRHARSLGAVHGDRLRDILKKYPESVKKEAEPLLASLNEDAEKQSAVINNLVQTLKGGDIRRGQAIFNGALAACSTCHAIGYLGGNLGPDLTKVGQVRTERDLIEAIVYPSASFVRSFEPYRVFTKDGNDFSGILKKDGPDEVVLGTGAGVETRIARSDIAEMRPGKVSIMPQGLNEQLSPQEMADLVAFLKANR